MPSFKIARKTFSTTARRLGVDEGYTRTMLGQKDKSVSISYVDYDDPKLFAKLCLEHINVLRAFDTIRIYNRWVKKIDEVFGSDWSTGPTYIKQIQNMFIPLLPLHFKILLIPISHLFNQFNHH